MKPYSETGLNIWGKANTSLLERIIIDKVGSNLSITNIRMDNHKKYRQHNFVFTV